MQTLDEIAIAHGTDKATVFTRTYAKPKGYTVHMARFFEPLRDKPIKMLEIGIGGGESARTWLDFFENGSIYGVDVVEKTNPWNTPKSGVHPRYTFLQGDQSDRTMWACFLADCGRDFDIIIDDGSHVSKDIITAFQCLWPVLRPSGFYAVEDLACTYGDETFCPPGWPTHLEWLTALLHKTNRGEGDIESVHFSQELAILQKR